MKASGRGGLSVHVQLTEEIFFILSRLSLKDFGKDIYEALLKLSQIIIIPSLFRPCEVFHKA